MVELDRLRELVRVLRGPKGCPWDREQDHESLKPCLIEEAYEVLDAIDSRDPGALKEELGDLLLQVLAHCQIAEEGGVFSLEDVLKALTEKVVRRHSHVFGDVKVENSSEALKNWSRIKQMERNEKGSASVLDGVPHTLPSLLKAQRVTEKAAQVGFDWKDTEGVKEKILEEWREFEEAIETRDAGATEKEFGDLLLSFVNLARFLKIDSEGALGLAVKRFEKRFRFIERELSRRGKSVSSSDAEETGALWSEAKSRLEES
jgi:tetrapyrrole methylase family protein/MazG family protein